MLKAVDLGENLHSHHHVLTINADETPWSNIANMEYGFSPKTDRSFVNDILTSGASLDTKTSRDPICKSLSPDIYIKGEQAG